MDGAVNIALALVRGEHGWLISRRAGGRVFAGLWEFPGGKMEPGESPEEAAVREVAEETGLTVEPLAVIGELWSVSAGSRVTLHLVHCRPIQGEPSPRDPAVLEVCWATLDELGHRPMPPANAEILSRLQALDS